MWAVDGSDCMPCPMETLILTGLTPEVYYRRLFSSLVHNVRFLSHSSELRDRSIKYKSIHPRKDASLVAVSITPNATLLLVYVQALWICGRPAYSSKK